MQVQQLIQMKKQQQTVQVAAAPQQKAGQPQPGQATVQQKVMSLFTYRDLCLLRVSGSNSSLVILLYSIEPVTVFNVFSFPLDWHTAGDSADRPARSAATAKGDLYHHPTPIGNQDPVLRYIAPPGPETSWSPANPGASSVPTYTTEYFQ